MGGSGTDEPPVHCEAAIRYLATSPDAGDSIAEVVTPIHDGRRADLRLDEAGITIDRLPAEVDDWDDLAAVNDSYLPDIAARAKELSGGHAVLFYPVIVRWSGAPEGSDTGPIRAAHSDYAESYLDIWKAASHPYRELVRPSMRVAGVSDRDLADVDRIVTLQFWRNIGPVHPDFPLAFCDGRTVDRSEFVVYPVETYAGARTEFESLLLTEPRAGSDRRWYTFPGLEPDEVAVFRSFDSDRVADGRPFWTPHVAFRDPTAGPSAPPRRSVEMRAICLFWN